jgi:SAM-dependent methyltransferase
VTALEPDPSALVGAAAIADLSRTSGLPIAIVQNWGETLPFADASFDLVYCRQVLHHAADLNTLCAEASRVLRPGGLMIAVREHVLSHRRDLQVFLDGHPLQKLYGGEHAFLLSDYLSALKSAGLTVRNAFNPYETDINLYPATVDDLRARWARKLRLPSGAFVPRVAATFAGRLSSAPGRLYSFVASKDVAR